MFKPLDMLREIREDHQLTTAEFVILVCCVLRTDSRSGRVRASQQMLAEDAHVDERTVRRFFRSKTFEHYFESELIGRRRVLTWLTPDEHRTDTGHHVQNTGHHVRPSASTSATSATSAEEEFRWPTDEELEAEVLRKVRAL